MTQKPHLLIVEGRFYGDLANELVKGAVAAIKAAGATYERVPVPGAFEIPGAIRLAWEACKAGRKVTFDGYVALGCVIRGETSHYDYVCSESARGLQDLAVGHGLAVGYGIITAENRDQAWQRAHIDKGNKGAGAVNAALAMIALKHNFRADAP